MPEKRIYTTIFKSPCGDLKLGSFDDSLCLCDWHVEKHRNMVDRHLSKWLDADFVEGDSETLRQATAQLEEYFRGERKTFDIKLLFVGTDFQKKVWNALLDIPYGVTVSYAELAGRIGHPTSFRAVANANGANCISIFAPCHRVIGSDGFLTGYGGGLKQNTSSQPRKTHCELMNSYSFLAVFLGGGIGSVLRYGVQVLLHERVVPYNFPWATFTVNILGCFLIGLFYALTSRFNFSPETRLFLTVGLCGGFTTFSTFSNDSLLLLREGELTVSLLYIAASVVLGILACLFGTSLIKS